MKRAAFFLFLLLFSFGFAQPIEKKEFVDRKPGISDLEKRLVFLNLKNREEGGVGYDDGYSTLQFFLARRTFREQALFFDLRGHVFNDGKMAANAGGGYRFRVGTLNAMLGANAYYDYRDTSGMAFHQVGAGLELFTKPVDFRVNGYFPIGDTDEFISRCFKCFCGTRIILEEKNQLALPGFDAEIARSLYTFDNGMIYGGLAGYYFKKGECNTHLGGRVRIRGDFVRYLTAELIYTYDSLYHGHFQGQVSLNLPLGDFKRRSYNYRKVLNDYTSLSYIAQQTYRNDMIVLCEETKDIIAQQPCCSCDPICVFQVNNKGCDCYTTLKEAEAASVDNAIIYVHSGDGTTKGMDQGIVLREGQQLLGSGTCHTICTRQGTIVIPAMSCDLPTITNTTDDVVQLDRNNVVSGLQIKNGVSEGISSDFASNALIENNIISGNAGSGIALFGDEAGCATTCINNNCIINNGLNGVALRLLNPQTKYDLIVKNNIIQDNFNQGVRTEGTVCSITHDFTGNVIQRNGTTTNHRGVDIDFIEDSVATNFFVSNIFADNGNDGLCVNIEDSTKVVSFLQNNNAFSNGGAGIQLRSNDVSAHDILMKNNTTANSTFNGTIYGAFRGSSQTNVASLSNMSSGNGSSGFRIVARDDTKMRLLMNNDMAVSNQENNGRGSFTTITRENSEVCATYNHTFTDRTFELRPVDPTSTLKVESSTAPTSDGFEEDNFFLNFLTTGFGSPDYVEPGTCTCDP